MTPHHPVLCVDFDYTIWSTKDCKPMEGARETINILREQGWKVIVHSCNSPEWIERCLRDHDIRFDSIWTGQGKPVGTCYLDDRGLKFLSWSQVLEDLEHEMALPHL